MDYGARWYDASIGRWGQIDPLAEKYYGWSVYNYGLDNPVLMVDPDGRETNSPIFDRNGNFLGVDSEGYTGEIIINGSLSFWPPVSIENRLSS